MSLEKGKHIVQEIDGVLCTLVETGINSDRLAFLTEILEFNKFEVKTAEITKEGDANPTYVIGVNDLTFNPVISVYGQYLKRKNGEKVSPAFWNQTKEVDKLPYFDYREKNPNAINEDEFLPNPWAYRTI